MAHNLLGTALASQGRRDEATTQYRQALADNPGYAEAYCNLARPWFLWDGSTRRPISFGRRWRSGPSTSRPLSTSVKSCADRESPPRLPPFFRRR